MDWESILASILSELVRIVASWATRKVAYLDTEGEGDPVHFESGS